MTEEVEHEEPKFVLKLGAEKFPLSMQAIHPVSGQVLYSKTIHYPAIGTKDVLRFPSLGQRVNLKLTFGDGEVAVFSDLLLL